MTLATLSGVALSGSRTDPLLVSRFSCLRLPLRRLRQPSAFPTAGSCPWKAPAESLVEP